MELNNSFSDYDQKVQDEKDQAALIPNGADHATWSEDQMRDYVSKQDPVKVDMLADGIYSNAKFEEDGSEYQVRAKKLLRVYADERKAKGEEPFQHLAAHRQQKEAKKIRAEQDAYEPTMLSLMVGDHESQEGYDPATAGRAAITHFLSQKTGIPESDVDDKYDMIRNIYGAQHLGMKGEITDERFRSAAAKEIDTGIKRRERSKEIQESVLQYVITGGRVSDLELDDDEKELASRVEFGVLRRFRQVLPIAGRMMKQVSEKQGVESSVNTPKEDLGAVLREAAKLPKSDRNKLIQVMWAMAEKDSISTESVSEGLGLSLKRGTESFGHNVLNTVLDYIQGNAERELSARGANTKEISEGHEESKALGELYDDIRSAEAILKKVEPIDNWLNDEFEQGLYDSTQSAPYIVSGFLGPLGLGVNAMAFGRNNDTNLRYQYPEMDENQRKLVGGFSGALEAGMQTVQAKTLMKGAPKLKALLGKMKVQGVAGTLGSRMVQTAGAEYAQERVENLMLPIVQDIGSAISDDIPDVDAEEWAGHLYGSNGSLIWDPRTFFAVLPLSILGAGGSTAMDKIGAEGMRKAFTGEDQMRLFGLNVEEAGMVSEYAKTSTFKAHGAFKSILGNKNIEEREAAIEEAIGDGSLARVRVDEVIESKGFKEQNQSAEAAGMPFIVEPKTEGDYYEIRQEGKMTKFVDKENLEEEVTRAHEEAAVEQMRELDTSIQDSIKFFEEKHEGVKIIDSTDKANSFRSQVDRGIISTDQAMERIQIYEKANNIEPGLYGLEDYSTLGINKVTRLKGDIVSYSAKIFKGATALDVIEEASEGYMKAAIERGDTDYAFFEEKLREYAATTEQEIFQNETATEQEVIEAFSDLATAYIHNERGNESIPQALKKFLNQLKEVAAQILAAAKLMRQSSKLKEAKDAGKLDSELEFWLSAAVGLDEEGFMARMQKEHEAELMADLNEGLAEVKDSLKWKLPRPSDVKADEALKGEVQRIWDQMTKVDRNGRKQAQAASEYFAPKGSDIDLDDLRQELNEQDGFSFATPSEMLDALDESIQGRPYYAQGEYNGYDESFSISPQQDADYMAAVESGDVEAQQAMVDDAAKAAGYDSPKVFHGTSDTSFTEFKVSEAGKNMGVNEFGPRGFWFTTKKQRAEIYKEGGRVISAYLKLRKMFQPSGDTKYSGLEFAESDADHMGVSTVFVVKSPNQIKSADPVTYDSEGSVIPLSQRFNEAKDSISFSIDVDSAKIVETRKHEEVKVVKIPDFLPTVKKIDAARLFKDPKSDNYILGMHKNDDSKVKFKVDATSVKKSVLQPNKNETVDHAHLIRVAAAYRLPEIIKKAISVEVKDSMPDRGAESVHDLYSAISWQGKQYLVRVKGIITNEENHARSMRVEDIIIKNSPSTEAEGDGITNPTTSVAGDTLLVGDIFNQVNPFSGESFSVAPMSQQQDLLAALDKRLLARSPRKVEIFTKMRDEVQKIRLRHVDSTFKKGMLSQKNQSKADRQWGEMVRDMGTLNAMLRFLPAEVSARVGGATSLVKFKTSNARRGELLRRLAMIDEHLETHLRKEYISLVDDLVKKNRPKKGKMDKVAKGKITPEGHTELAAIEKVLDMDAKELEKAVRQIQSDQQAALTMEEGSQDEKDARDKAIMEADVAFARVTTFGGLRFKTDPMSAVSVKNALDEIQHLVDKGRLRYQLKMEEQREHRAMLKHKALEVISGGKRRKLRSERLTDMAGSKVSKFIKREHSRNISFEFMLNGLSRLDKESETLDSFLNKYFGRAVHKATHNESMANARKKSEMIQKVGDIYGIDIVEWGAKEKIEQIIIDHSTLQETTGVIMEEQSVTKKLKSYRAEVEGLADGTVNHIHDGYSFIKLTKEEIAEFRDLLAEDNQKKGTKKQNFEIIRTTEGRKTEQKLSQDTALFLSMMHKQEGLRPAMENHGYSPEVLTQIEDFLTDESKALREWLFMKYDGNYAYFNTVFADMFGVNLPKVENYSPARSVHAGRQAQDMIDSDSGKQSTTPGMAMERIKHKAEPRYDVGALALYSQHVEATEHFVHWAKPVAEMRSVFMDKEVRETIIDHHGTELYAELIERIDFFADGGNAKANQNKYLDHLRKTFTVAKLSYNWGVFLKQLTSIPAYTFDMKVKDFLKYENEFFANPVENWQKMWALDYTKSRFDEGYDRDVMFVMNSFAEKKGKLDKAAEFGMITGRAGDIIPVIVGGYAAYRNGFEKAKSRGASESVAEAEGVLAFEMSTDRAQQSGNLKDQSSYSLQGSLPRVLTMFTTSPRQYYANMAEAVLDMKAGRTWKETALNPSGGRKGSAKRAAKAAFIGHVVLPSLFFWTSAFTRNIVKDEEDRDETSDLLKGWAASMALGGFSGVFIWGQITNQLTSGYDYELPVMSFGKEIGYGESKLRRLYQDFTAEDAQEITAYDVIEVLDHFARATSLAVGGGATWYDIGTRMSKSVGFSDDDLEYVMMSTEDAALVDFKKAKKEIYGDPLPDDATTQEKRDQEKGRWTGLLDELHRVKAMNPADWDSIREKLKSKKGLIPKDVLDKI